MPIIYRRNCDQCGSYYEGRGKFYCSTECAKLALTDTRDVITEGAIPSFDFDLIGLEDELFTHTKGREARKLIFNQFKNFTGKIAVMSDMEIPFHDSNLIIKATEIAKQEGATLVVFGGDCLHHYCMSTFAKDKAVSLKLERDIGTKIFSYVKEELGHAVAIEGNHEERLTRFFGRQHNFHQWKVLLDNEDPDLLRIVCNKTNVAYAEGWWVKIGDLIISHPLPYSKVWGRNLTNSVDYFRERGDMVKNFGALAQGHSHKALQGIYQGIKVFNTGCLCKTLDFNVGNARTQPFWTRAFALISMKNGETQYNESRVHIFDIEE